MIAQLLQEATDYLKGRGLTSLTGVLSTGSGQHMVLESITVMDEIPYNDIPGMKTSNIPGQDGLLRIVQGIDGFWAIWVGRRHFYQGFSIAEIGFYLDISSALGAKQLLCVNARGGLNPCFEVGNMVAIEQFKSFIPTDNKNGPLDGGPWRNTSKTICNRLNTAASSCNLPIRKGKYVGVYGPTYETAADVAWLRSMGCDVVGMSTTPELIHGSDLALDVAALSLVANVHGRSENLSHKEVVESSHRSANQLAALINSFLLAI